MIASDEFSQYYAELLQGTYDCVDRIVLNAFCAKQGIPIIEARARDRKHELAQPHEPNDPKFCGLFFVIKSNAPAPVWEVKRNGDGPITEIRHRKSWPYVRHFFFHLIDQEWVM